MTIAPKGGYQVVLELKTENNNRKIKENPRDLAPTAQIQT